MRNPKTPAITMKQRLEMLTGKIRLAEITGDEIEVNRLMSEKQKLIEKIREEQRKATA